MIVFFFYRFRRFVSFSGFTGIDVDIALNMIELTEQHIVTFSKLVNFGKLHF